MSLRALNRWRWLYAGWLAIPVPPPWKGLGQGTRVAGAALWLTHDLAHGRWRFVALDLAALAALQRRWRVAAMVVVALAAAFPEQPPSPFVWARHTPRRGGAEIEE